MNRFFAYMLGALIVMLPIAEGYIRKVLFTQGTIFFTLLFLAISSLVGMAWLIARPRHGSLSTAAIRQRPRPEFTVSLLDLAVAGYLLYGILHIVLVRHLEFDRIVVFKWLAMAGGYMLFRTLPDKKPILHTLLLSGVVQSAITVMQLSGVMASNHSLFAVTGSFANPGQLGGYLAVASVIGAGLLARAIQRRRHFEIVLFAAALAAMGYASYLADSRAGWLGIGVGVLYLFSGSILKFIKKHLIASILGIAVLSIGASVILYNHRPGSVDARMLIWRVSGEMIAEKPIAGHGAAAFKEYYMLYQAKYFKNRPDSRYVAIADNPTYPYNEFIHILIEQGLIGLLMFFPILFFVFSFRARNPVNAIFRSALLALFIFSMFSYPADVFPLIFLFAILTGCCGSKGLRTFKISKSLMAAGILAAMAIGVVTVKTYRFYRETYVHLKALREENLESIAFMERHFGKFSHDPNINIRYLIWLSGRITNAEDHGTIARVIPTSDTYCTLGEAFQSGGLHERAEYYFKTASNMVPNRITPNYFLWKLYLETHQAENARQTARIILAQPVKVETPYTTGIITEIRQWLSEDGPY